MKLLVCANSAPLHSSSLLSENRKLFQWCWNGRQSGVVPPTTIYFLQAQRFSQTPSYTASRTHAPQPAQVSKPSNAPSISFCSSIVARWRKMHGELSLKSIEIPVSMSVQIITHMLHNDYIAQVFYNNTFQLFTFFSYLQTCHRHTQLHTQANQCEIPFSLLFIYIQRTIILSGDHTSKCRHIQKELYECHL